MTLDTRIFVLDQIDPQEVFQHCRELLGCTDSHRWTDETWSANSGHWTLSNTPGQGLPAWLMLFYRPGTPLRTSEQAAEHDEGICNLPDCSWYDEEAGACDGSDHLPACWLTVSFDTAYGYSDERGYGCGDLHAELVARLGQWLDARGIRWSWQNEFTGEIHASYERLLDLASGGFEASAWFRTTVLPAIEARTARP
ncbi:hypothetical protein E6W39_24350 [Kitasatospora acidiphila]|uniref:Uncharacterized protein n=1 Tax=Kitasatospora acidiphila TaxID=2567942 RepID=A0A540W8T8_9ACTN|nr:hypothetical protein [Kitasatospora acidiphila]TQF04784.1 hypothetical protein E6W39_24350 [Kitasatospora acidiphila]